MHQQTADSAAREIHQQQEIDEQANPYTAQMARWAGFVTFGLVIFALRKKFGGKKKAV